jgi:uncharacterized membrane protein
MHLIPQSWSHFHILVSVFPSCGFLFVIGLYVTSLIANNDGLKRTCLYLFVFMGLLAIPTYVSGTGSMDALAQNPKFTRELMDAHYSWSLFATAALVITGIAALVELLRARNAKEATGQLLNIVLGLAVVTAIVSVYAAELGWEISHFELRINAAASALSTPQGWSHVHMMLNHVPTVGFVITLVIFILGIAMDNSGMKRAGLVLFVICAVVGVPTYVTGAAAMWALTQPPIAEISKAVINDHRDMALLTLFGLGFTGGAAWIELWRYRHLGRLSNTSLYVTLGFALITLGIMAETGHRGGQINHPEIRLATDVLSTDPNAGLSPSLELLINQVQWFVPWQTVHFFGFSLIFGTVLVVSLRVLGFMKSVPFSAVHRVLPLGFFGVIMNVFSGMLMMLADTYRYVVTDTTFAPKMALIVIGAAAVLYYSIADSIWSVKAGEDAPASAKAVAILVLLSWTGVIMGGRLLPYV